MTGERGQPEERPFLQQAQGNDRAVFGGKRKRRPTLGLVVPKFDPGIVRRKVELLAEFDVLLYPAETALTRARIEQSIMPTPIAALARQILKMETRSAPRPALRLEGLDDGVRL